MVHITGSRTQILPAEGAVDVILALPDPEQRLRIDLVAVRKERLECGIMCWYHYRRLLFAVTAYRVQGLITETSRELHDPSWLLHTSGEAMQLLSITL